MSKEHDVWKVLRKENYVEEFIPQAENMYDFIKTLVADSGTVEVDGKEIPVMKVFLDMWCSYSSETYRMLQGIIHEFEFGG